MPANNNNFVLLTFVVSKYLFLKEPIIVGYASGTIYLVFILGVTDCHPNCLTNL